MSIRKSRQHFTVYGFTLADILRIFKPTWPFDEIKTLRGVTHQSNVHMCVRIFKVDKKAKKPSVIDEE